MLQPCQDNYSTTFASYEGMRRYHEKESLESRWHRCRVNELHIEPLDKASPLYGTPSAFAAGISAESVEDTAENLGLAMRVDGSYYPVRSTAYKSLLDRAKISGSALPKLSRQRLASVLNDCLELYSSETLLLIRDEKISAAHSGDSMDYSVLPIDELLKVLTKKLDDRFPGSMFQGGYTLDFQVTPHQLRHTYITNLIYSGADPKTVQYLAGHKHSKITMDIYAKVKYNKPKELSSVVNKAFAPKKGATPNKTRKG